MKKQALYLALAAALLFAPLTAPLSAAAAGNDASIRFLAGIEMPAGDSIPISNREDLQRIGRSADFPESANYHLTNDISLSGGAFTPIRTFSGIFDGQGHVIRSLTVFGNRASAGMFEVLSPDAVIKNLGLEDVNISINGYEAIGIAADVSGAIAGGIAAVGGSISNCYVTGVISVQSSGNSDSSVYAYAGGLSGAGSNIINSYNVAAVTASAGLEGRSASSFDAISYAGGIIGYGPDGYTVENCINAGPVTANSRNTSGSRFEGFAGGVSGYSEANAVFRNCYWNTGSGQTVNGVPLTDTAKKGLGYGTGQATELTEAQMQAQESFNNLDFNSIWAVMPGVNNGFPGLRAFGAYPSTWAEADVIRASELGLIPESLQSNYTEAATRADFAALAVTLYETVTRIDIQAGDNPFTDTRDINAIKAAAIGVTTGTGDGTTFSPDAPLTREQAATMLSRLANAAARPLQGQAPSFADNDSISEYAAEAVGQMQATGIMRGDGDRFNPQDPYTREQSIITILRLYNAVS